MRRLPRLGVFVAAVLVSGCGGGHASHTQPATAPNVAPPATGPAAAPNSAPTRARPWYRRGLHSFGFQSPTGNIRCGIESDDHTHLLCKTLNNQKAVVLDQFASLDTNVTVTLPGADPTLAYSKWWWSKNFVCWSQEDGMYCRSLYSRHGFKISRAGIEDRIFPSVIIHLGGGDGGGGTYSGGSGSTVRCNDGTFSNSGGIQGACSWHGGVAP